jgi:hypothetical protein
MIRRIKKRLVCLMFGHDFVVSHNKWARNAKLFCSYCGKVEIVSVIHSISRDDIQSKRIERVGTVPILPPN